MYPESPTLARGLAAVAERGGLDLPWITAQRRGLADTMMETLRAQPLEIDTAVQLALLTGMCSACSLCRRAGKPSCSMRELEG